MAVVSPQSLAAAEISTPLAVAVRRFVVAGAASTALDYLLFIGLTKLFHIPLERVWIAKAASGAIAVGVSFALNRGWVFRRHGRVMDQVPRFLVVTLIGVYALQTPLTQLFSTVWSQVGEGAFRALDALGAPAAAPSLLTEALVVKTTAFVVATAISTTWNFCAYRYWVFRSPRTSP